MNESILTTEEVMEKLIKKYVGMLWQAFTGEGIETAFPNDKKKIEDILEQLLKDFNTKNIED